MPAVSATDARRDGRRRSFVRACAAAVIALALPQGHAHAQTRERVALVIGNGDYLQGPLKNARPDARAIAGTLRGLDFDVKHLENLRREELLDALRDFTDRARTAQVRVLYFAGHGAQLRGQNWLLPVDAVLRDEEEIATRAANASEAIERLGRLRQGVNIVVLDACRSVPVVLAARTRSGSGTRAVSSGLAQMVAPAGTLVAYSTAPGAIAFDGADGHSPYTRHLIGQMREPALPVEQLFKRVRAAVREETGERQTPWETSSLVGDFCFRAGPNGECGGGRVAVNAPPVPSAAPSAGPSQATRR
jgi:uncharacterized caspase-like protein